MYTGHNTFCLILLVELSLYILNRNLYQKKNHLLNNIYKSNLL